MDCIVPGVAKESDTTERLSHSLWASQMALFHSFLWLSNQSLGWEETLERKTATNSSFLAWEMPWIEERGRLQSMGSQTVGHN